MGQIKKRQKILDDQAQAQLVPAIAMVSMLHPIRLSVGRIHASPAPEFPTPPHATPFPKIPPCTAHAVPDLEIPLPIAHASSHLNIPSPTPCTFFDPAHL